MISSTTIDKLLSFGFKKVETELDYDKYQLRVAYPSDRFGYILDYYMDEERIYITALRVSGNTTIGVEELLVNVNNTGPGVKKLIEQLQAAGFDFWDK